MNLSAFQSQERIHQSGSCSTVRADSVNKYEVLKFEQDKFCIKNHIVLLVLII